MLALARQTARVCARRAPFSTAAASQAANSEAAEILQLEVRVEEGSRASRRLRKNGLLPGILYGEGLSGETEKTLVAMNTRTFQRLHRKLWSSIQNQVFDVQVGSTSPVKAYMRDVQFHPGEPKCSTRDAILLCHWRGNTD